MKLEILTKEDIKCLGIVNIGGFGIGTNIYEFASSIIRIRVEANDSNDNYKVLNINNFKSYQLKLFPRNQMEDMRTKDVWYKECYRTLFNPKW